MKQLSKGVQLEDGPAAFRTISFEGGEGLNQWYNVTLTEGRNREVRRLWEAVGVQVSRLIRVRYGDIDLPKGLPRGGWAEAGSAGDQLPARAGGIEAGNGQQNARGA